MDGEARHPSWKKYRWNVKTQQQRWRRKSSMDAQDAEGKCDNENTVYLALTYLAQNYKGRSNTSIVRENGKPS